MTRFLISPENVKGNRITIEGREVHHLRNVLRLRKGERVICFDGRGKEYEGAITSLSSGQAEIKIEKSEKLEKELPLKIALAPSLIRASKMDLIIQKCTELGVFRLMPMRTERSIIKLDEVRSRARRERWQRLAGEAAKQSGRVQTPRIEEVRDFAFVLREAANFDLGIILWEEESERRRLKEALTKRSSLPLKNIILLIGPEGGWTTGEVAEAKKAGLLSVSLGSRILKSETAAIVAVAIVAYELGS